MRLYTNLTKAEAEKKKRKIDRDEKILRDKFGGGNYSSVEIEKTFEGPGRSSDRYAIVVEKLPNPGTLLKNLRKGITGRIKLVRGKLIIKT